jgi:hypothetical protein
MFGNARADRASAKSDQPRANGVTRSGATRAVSRNGSSGRAATGRAAREYPAGPPAKNGRSRGEGRGERGAQTRSAGPYDSEDPVVESLGRSGRVDFGSLRIPMPGRAQLQVERGKGDLLRAVHVLVPAGRVSLSALAAPRSKPLWRGLAGEIADSLGNDGARVRTEWGEWGREVEASSNGAVSRFIGVDGPRWMLYGVATGPAEDADELADVLRDMMRGSVVHRGADPLPVKTVLPLRLPEHLEENVARAREASKTRSRKSKTARPNGSRPAGGATPVGDVASPRRSGPSVGQPGRPVPARGAPPPAARPAAASLSSGPSGPPTGPAIGALGAVAHQVSRPVLPAAPGPMSGGLPRASGLPQPSADPLLNSGAFPPISGGMPPVPAAEVVGGAPRWTSGAESTWSGANPVVNADQVAQQPAWAQLGGAPSFWPEEPLPSGEPATPSTSPSSVLSSSLPSSSPSSWASSPGYDPAPGYEPRPDQDPLGSFDRPTSGLDLRGYPPPARGDLDGFGAPAGHGSANGLDGLGSLGPLDGLGSPSGYSALDDLIGRGSHRTDSAPSYPASTPEPAYRAPEPEPAPEPAEPVADGWSGRASDLLSSTDGLHAVLTLDAAATQGWAARRNRHRQDEA